MKYPEDDDEDETHFDVVLEARRLLHIAMPSVAMQFNLLIIFQQSASVVGRMWSSNELAGFSLGNLVGNMTYLSVVVGALSAVDTLMPQAYGAKQYPEIGRLAIRSFIVCCILLLPAVTIFVRPKLLQWILYKFGQDPIASELASYWIPLYLLGALPNLIFRVIHRFLITQNVAWPPVYASTIPTYIIHPLLLQWLVPLYGLSGSAIALSITQWLCLIFLILYLSFVPTRYESNSWPGLSWSFIKESVQIGPMLQLLDLSFGGVLALSEWWFWEMMCFVAGSFGVIELCAHTIAYNLVPLSFMLPLGISIGLIVRMGTVIASNHKKAKKMAYWTMGFTVALGSILVTILWICQITIIKLFTNDVEVIRESQAIWPMVCFHIWVLNIFGVNGGIMRALGMQWHIAAIVTFSLWFLALPLVLLFAIQRHGGLHMEWYIMPVCYTIMQLFLIFSYSVVDWTVQIKRIHGDASCCVAAHKGKAHPGATNIGFNPTEKTSLLKAVDV